MTWRRVNPGEEPPEYAPVATVLPGDETPGFTLVNSRPPIYVRDGTPAAGRYMEWRAERIRQARREVALRTLGELALLVVLIGAVIVILLGMTAVPAR